MPTSHSLPTISTSSPTYDLSSTVGHDLKCYYKTFVVMQLELGAGRDHLLLLVLLLRHQLQFSIGYNLYQFVRVCYLLT